MGFQISIWEFLNAFSGVVNRFSINGNDGANRSGQGQKQTDFADRASSPAGFASKGADFVEGEPSLSAVGMLIGAFMDVLCRPQFARMPDACLK
jgi:hypothetical protein